MPCVACREVVVDAVYATPTVGLQPLRQDLCHRQRRPGPTAGPGTAQTGTSRRLLDLPSGSRWEVPKSYIYLLCHGANPKCHCTGSDYWQCVENDGA